jgi:hypothetical protein
MPTQDVGDDDPTFDETAADQHAPVDSQSGTFPSTIRAGIVTAERDAATRTHFIDDANELRSRAEQARMKAEKIANAECKRMMLCIADMYEKMARWADERRGTHKLN